MRTRAFRHAIGASVLIGYVFALIFLLPYAPMSENWLAFLGLGALFAPLALLIAVKGAAPTSVSTKRMTQGLVVALLFLAGALALLVLGDFPAFSVVFWTAIIMVALSVALVRSHLSQGIGRKGARGGGQR